MILETVQNKKLIELYQILTQSDFKGNRQSLNAIELLYLIGCLDVATNLKEPSSFKPTELAELAKELKRVIDDEPPMLFAKGLIEFMRNDNKSVKDIHSMSTITLKQEIEKIVGDGY